MQCLQYLRLVRAYKFLKSALYKHIALFRVSMYFFFNLLYSRKWLRDFKYEEIYIHMVAL